MRSGWNPLGRMLSDTLMALTASMQIPNRLAIVRIGRSDERSSLMIRSRMSYPIFAPLPQNRPLLRIFIAHSFRTGLPTSWTVGFRQVQAGSHIGWGTTHIHYSPSLELRQFNSAHGV